MKHKRHAEADGGSNRPTLLTASPRAFVVCCAAFVAAGAVILAIQFAAPFTRGWWLAAYLFLVGGVSQGLLGPGLSVIARRAGARRPTAKATHAQLVLWNVGTLVVAIADLATAPRGILFGSLLLLVALASFTGSLRTVSATALQPTPRWAMSYVLLVLFLASSVFVGTALGNALPGQ
jgi:hypothetical protein